MLNGQKTWISNGGIAEFYVVFATVVAGHRLEGRHRLVVEKGDEGVTFGEPMRKMGQRAIVNTEVFLQDCRLTDDRRLGEEGKGFYSLMHTFDESGCTWRPAPSASPGPPSSIRSRTPHAKRVRQADRAAPGGRLPAGRHGDRIDAARLLTHHAARLMDEGRHVPRRRAQAKLFASETATWVTWAALQTLGGWGYRASTRSRSGCATPAWRSSRRAPPTSSG